MSAPVPDGPRRERAPCGELVDDVAEHEAECYQCRDANDWTDDDTHNDPRTGQADRKRETRR